MIYMNNAATGYPKFPSMINAMSNALKKGMLSTNRDSVISQETLDAVFNIRENIGKIIHAKEPHEICLTSSDTIALNMVIFGMNLVEGDTVLLDDMAHNSLARPLIQLSKQKGVDVVTVHDMHDIVNVLSDQKSNVKAVFVSHASNVTGDVVDTEGIGRLLHSLKIPFIVDAAQTIGIYPIDVEKSYISVLVFAGHKCLNGPQGTGGFYIRKGLEIHPILFGGNGLESTSLVPEEVYPDSFEVGTPPMHDLIGLNEAIKEVMRKTDYQNKILSLTQKAHDQLASIPEVEIYGSPLKEIPVISFNIKGIPCQTVGQKLADAGIVCRTGVHCASLAMLKLKLDGTVRVSFGYYNKIKDVDYLISTIKNIIHENLA